MSNCEVCLREIENHWGYWCLRLHRVMLTTEGKPDTGTFMNLYEDIWNALKNGTKQIKWHRPGIGKPRTKG